MNILPFEALACPLDGAPLQRVAAVWRCPSGHSFDVAREGHTHLLPVQHKRSRDPGDSKEMVAARRRFLDSGAYDQVAAAVARTVLTRLPGSGGLACVDAGCGEGHYLRWLAETAQDQNGVRSLALLGVDISKWAVVAAAKRLRTANWVVGSNANLPVQTGTLDCLLCMFGFPVYGEFARVLKPGGLLLQVDAGPDHLRELREIIYPVLKPERVPDSAPPPGFDGVDDEIVRYSLHLSDHDRIADLLAMTPHLFRASADGRARAAALRELTVTVDVRLRGHVRTDVAGRHGR